jgi:DNA-binding LacI/PurR family transcriptional regulator
MTKRNSPSKVTIVEVARQSGVSLGTVSRVINNDVHVAPETRERVTNFMREMGYVANRQARGLRSSKTNVIGVLVPDLGTGYIGEIMRGIDAELALSQLDLMLFTTHRTAIKEANYVANLVAGMVDGLLIVLPRSEALIRYIPTFVQIAFSHALLPTKFARVGLAWHTSQAPDEIDQLVRELAAMVEQAGLPVPAIRRVLGQTAIVQLSR